MSFTALLDDVPQRVRARFRLGKFIGVDGDVASFGLPNAHVIPRCEEVKAEVETALAARFSRPITIALSVDTGQTTTSAPPTVSAAMAPPPSEGMTDVEPEDIGDISELKNAPDIASTGIDRLTQAFPGAEVVGPQD